MEHKYQGGRKPKPPKEITHTICWWLCMALSYLWPSFNETGEVAELQKCLQPQHWFHLQPQAAAATCPGWGKPPTQCTKISGEKARSHRAARRLGTPAAADDWEPPGSACSLLFCGLRLGEWLLAHRQWPGLPACLSITPPLKPGS